MAKVTGVVEASQYPNKYNGHSIKVGGKFYNSKYQITANGKPVEAGMNIEFEDGGKNYCQKAVLAGGGSTASSSTPTGVATLKDRMIVRQNSLGHAVDTVRLQYDIFGNETDDTGDETLTRILNIAKEFEKYSMCEDLTSPPAFEE